MSWASRHNPAKWKHRPRSFDLNLSRAYRELPEASQREIDSIASREALRVIEGEQDSRSTPFFENGVGSFYPPSVFASELALERSEQWEALVCKGCAGRLEELAQSNHAEDGPEERLEWALARVQRDRAPGYVRPRTIAEWLARFQGPRGGDPSPIGLKPKEADRA